MFTGQIRQSTVPVTCPRCEYVTDVRVQDVELEGMVLCPGCRETIRLVDDAYSTRTSLRRIRNAERELERILAGLGRSGVMKFTLR